MKLELRTALELKYNDFIGATFEELVLPEGMTEIPGSLCEDCRQLRKVVLPSTIKRIDVGAFNGCIKLEEINLPDGLEEIADDVFQGCHALRHIILPPGLKRLSPEIFDNSGLESIELPDDLESIGYWAFYGCNSLKSLEIPSSVREIGFGIVSAHDDFSLVCHAEGFHVENDALIDDKNKELLCCWTTQEHYVVPECVDKIACISNNAYVKTISVKQSVELTTEDAFAFDMGLKEIDFQGGVTGITKDTFYLCNYPDKIIIKNNV
jgi:hypothetical protein